MSSAKVKPWPVCEQNPCDDMLLACWAAFRKYRATQWESSSLRLSQLIAAPILESSSVTLISAGSSQIGMWKFWSNTTLWLVRLKIKTHLKARIVIWRWWLQGPLWAHVRRRWVSRGGQWHEITIRWAQMWSFPPRMCRLDGESRKDDKKEKCKGLFQKLYSWLGLVRCQPLIRRIL